MFNQLIKTQRFSVKIIKENIVKLVDVDAIVNAANQELLPGGGVCGAIFQAAGRELERECQQYIQQYGIVPTSKLAVTSSCQLKKNNIKYIIHAVGPKYFESQSPEEELQICVQNILNQSFNQLRLKSVAIPAISSGIYGFPKGLCAQIFKFVIEEYQKETSNNQGEIILCNFDQETTTIFQKVFQQQNSF
ncbi:unnamed protein product [Paramecium pentaurelia]|uniref:Macro domain-containing protein n=1 Tax=Paramecium pentaurelia TaxID=43138 RepID=A0A8S1SJI8_9CILI|nr:unnamed protein product [Paramecium pentaurelia]